MNKKGFTVIELLASFTLTMIIVVFLFEIVLELKDVYVTSSLKTKVLNQNALIATKLDKDLDNLGVTSASCYVSNVAHCSIFAYSSVYHLYIRPSELDVVFNDGSTIKMPAGVTISNLSISTSGRTFVDASKDNAYIKISYEVKSNYFKKPIAFNYIYTYHSN